MERDRISPTLLISLLTLFGCDAPPGCGPVTSGTGGWPVQCDGMASGRENPRLASYLLYEGDLAAKRANAHDLATP